MTTDSDDTGADRLRRLLGASATGDQAAFAELYGLTKGKMFGVALGILKRRDLAEDVLQEAYVRIWRNAGRFNPAIASPVAWMATIVRNCAINIVRRPQLEADCDQTFVLNVVASDQSPLDGIQSAEDCGNAFAALRSLDPLQRRLIVAAYVRGESREQLARRFGVPVNTIKTWLRRAILNVRATMDGTEAPRRTFAWRS
jgi:RNA polymerase sigma-70 factor (ECF subfamily)